MGHRHRRRAFEAPSTAATGEAGGPAQVLPGEGGATALVIVGDDAGTFGAVAGALGLAG